MKLSIPANRYQILVALLCLALIGYSIVQSPPYSTPPRPLLTQHSIADRLAHGAPISPVLRTVMKATHKQSANTKTLTPKVLSDTGPGNPFIVAGFSTPIGMGIFYCYKFHRRKDCYND